MGTIKLYAPAYYKKFTCIADKCRHSCCIGWEIDVDDAAMQRYSALTEGYGKEILSTVDTADTPHFRLCANDRCPHLDDAGLCRIIAHLGESYLCHICREHPRFYNDTPMGREVGLGMACEEACRLILSSEDYARMEVVGLREGNAEVFDFDPLPLRGQLYRILSDTSLPYDHRLHLLAETCHVSLTEQTDEDWRALLDELEYLDASHRIQFSCFSTTVATPKALEQPLERALAYWIYRHTTAAWDEEDCREAVGFSLLCERLLASIAQKEELRQPEDLIEAARGISEELEYSEDNTRCIKDAFFSSPSYGDRQENDGVTQ